MYPGSTNKLASLIAASLLSVVVTISCSNSVTLSILGEDVPTVRALRGLSGEYLKTSGKKVNVKFVMDDYETMVRKANQDLSNGTSVYDVILQYNTALSSYVRNNYVLTLADLKNDEYTKLLEFKIEERLRPFQDDIFPRSWHEVGWYKSKDGAEEPIGIPFSANTMFLCYNKALFDNPVHRSGYFNTYHEQLEPPKTWQQLEQIASYFSRQPGLHGICMQGAPYFIYYEWANMAFSMGGGVMRKQWGWEGDQNTPLIISSPETIKATESYLRLRDFDGSTDFFATDAVTQRERMKAGDIALAIMWSDVAFDLVRGESEGKYDDRFGFAPLPGNKFMLAGGSYYVNRNTKHPREAVEYILHQMEKDNQVRLMLMGLCSPLRSTYNDERVKRIPYAEALRQSLENGVYMLEAGPDADAVIVTMSDALQRLFRERKSLSAEHALNEAQRDINSTRTEVFRQLSEQ